MNYDKIIDFDISEKSRNFVFYIIKGIRGE